MSAQSLAIISFLHDLFAVTWIGGMIAIGITFRPTVVQVLGQTPQTKKVLSTMQKRQSILAYISMVGLAITGALMAKHSPHFLGLFHFGNPYANTLATKHIFVIVMVIIALVRTLVLSKGQATPQRAKLSATLLYINIALGIGVLLLSSFGAALAG
ncbi:MAG TPA: hypothetical protein ENJ54_04420 [Chloroflexi bacterium]|nr:hypothetical protein [Chloroflexota bacterium]